jgi:hypothetical protein
MTPAERQARHRASLRQTGQASPPASVRRSLPRPRRWAAAVTTLIDLQDEYRAWVDNRPTSKARGWPKKLQAISEIDHDELQEIDPPLGYGRD